MEEKRGNGVVIIVWSYVALVLVTICLKIASLLPMNWVWVIILCLAPLLLAMAVLFIVLGGMV